MAQLTSWSPIFCRILRCFATKEMSAQPGIRTPDLLHVKPVCYHYATATSCNIELKVGSLNHLKYSLVSTFLSEINKAISYFIYLFKTLSIYLLFANIILQRRRRIVCFWKEINTIGSTCQQVLDTLATDHYYFPWRLVYFEKCQNKVAPNVSTKDDVGYYVWQNIQGFLFEKLYIYFTLFWVHFVTWDEQFSGDSEKGKWCLVTGQKKHVW